MGPNVRSLLCRSALPAALALSVVTLPAHAVSFAEPILDISTLTALEHQAETAAPKDRCFLYTELLHDWTELASRGMAAGDDSQANMAIAHADANAGRLKATLANDSKRLKNAELLLEHTVHHLSDMLRVASMDQHDTMQAALKHMNNVHDALLAQIFAH